MLNLIGMLLIYTFVAEIDKKRPMLNVKYDENVGVGCDKK